MDSEEELKKAEFEDRVASLSRLHAHILFWRMRGLDYDEIGRLLYSQRVIDQEWDGDTVQREFTQIYENLGYPKEMAPKTKNTDLRKNAFPAIKTLTNDDPNELDKFPLKQRPANVPNRQSVDNIRQGVDNNRQKVWPLVAGLLVLVLLVGAFLLGRGINSPPPPTTPIPTNTQETPATETLTAVLTNTPIATFTTAPSQTPTATTSTLTPTYIPTETLSPNTFFDDFADGLDPAWTKVFGNPVVSNEQLTAGELTLLSLGDPAWRDYQIEFDVTHISRHIAPGSNNNAIGVRATDMDNMVAFVFVVFDSSWYQLVDGKWNPVPNAIACCVNDPAHVTIRVEGNKFTANNRKDFRVSFIDNDHPSGNIFLWIFPNSIYDNFKVTLLNP